MSEWQDIVRQRPRDVDEAILCLRKTLDYFHARHDYRAIFLRSYYIVTLEIHAAVHQLGGYREPFFFDPAWVSRLAGRFSCLYFQSLAAAERGGPGAAKAWRLAYRMARERSSTVLLDLLLGLNAHVNHDLAYGIALNLKEHGDHAHHLLLPRRKFDHDQVHNLLVRCTPRIQEVLARDYGGGLLFLSRVFGRWDERLAWAGLRHCRERVWWVAISLLCAADEQEAGLVRKKLDRESFHLAKLLIRAGLWLRVVRFFARLLRKRRFGAIRLEEVGGLAAGGAPTRVLPASARARRAPPRRPSGGARPASGPGLLPP